MKSPKKGGDIMSNFELKYVIRKLMCGSHQNDDDTQIYRASQIEQKFNKRRNKNAYFK